MILFRNPGSSAERPPISPRRLPRSLYRPRRIGTVTTGSRARPRASLAAAFTRFGRCARARRRGRSARRERRAPTRASRSPASQMGSLTCFPMRFDDKTSSGPRPRASTTRRRARTTGIPEAVSKFTSTYLLLLDRRVSTTVSQRNNLLKRCGWHRRNCRPPSQFSRAFRKAPKYGDLSSRFLRDRLVDARNCSPPTISPGRSIVPAAENPRGAGAGALLPRRERRSQPPLLRTCGVRRVREDWFPREAPSCPTGQTTSRTIARDGERRAEPAHGGERGGSRSTERGFIPQVLLLRRRPATQRAAE